MTHPIQLLILLALLGRSISFGEESQDQDNQEETRQLDALSKNSEEEQEEPKDQEISASQTTYAYEVESVDTAGNTESQNTLNLNDSDEESKEGSIAPDLSNSEALKMFLDASQDNDASRSILDVSKITEFKVTEKFLIFLNDDQNLGVKDEAETLSAEKQGLSSMTSVEEDNGQFFYLVSKLGSKTDLSSLPESELSLLAGLLYEFKMQGFSFKSLILLSPDRQEREIEQFFKTDTAELKITSKINENKDSCSRTIEFKVNNFFEVKSVRSTKMQKPDGESRELISSEKLEGKVFVLPGQKGNNLALMLEAKVEDRPKQFISGKEIDRQKFVKDITLGLEILLRNEDSRTYSFILKQKVYSTYNIANLTKKNPYDFETSFEFLTTSKQGVERLSVRVGVFVQPVIYMLSHTSPYEFGFEQQISRLVLLNSLSMSFQDKVYVSFLGVKASTKYRIVIDVKDIAARDIIAGVSVIKLPKLTLSCTFEEQVRKC